MKRSKMPWYLVDDTFPKAGKKVIAKYNTDRGQKPRVIIAHRLLDTFAECNCEYDCDCVYDEKTDNFYYPAGWYEQVENWDDFACVRVCDGTITHWMPLPELP